MVFIMIPAEKQGLLNSFWITSMIGLLSYAYIPVQHVPRKFKWPFVGSLKVLQTYLSGSASLRARGSLMYTKNSHVINRNFCCCGIEFDIVMCTNPDWTSIRTVSGLLTSVDFQSKLLKPPLIVSHVHEMEITHKIHYSKR